MREPPCAAGSATDPNPNHNPNQEWIVKESRYEKTLEEEDLFHRKSLITQKRAHLLPLQPCAPRLQPCAPHLQPCAPRLQPYLGGLSCWPSSSTSRRRSSA